MTNRENFERGKVATVVTSIVRKRLKVPEYSVLALDTPLRKALRMTRAQLTDVLQSIERRFRFDAGTLTQQRRVRKKEVTLCDLLLWTNRAKTSKMTNAAREKMLYQIVRQHFRLPADRRLDMFTTLEGDLDAIGMDILLLCLSVRDLFGYQDPEYTRVLNKTKKQSGAWAVGTFAQTIRTLR